MGGLERQVADYHEREEEVQRLARESKQKVEDALSLKDQVSCTLNSAIRHLYRSIKSNSIVLW
jgi:hypothetical protein